MHRPISVIAPLAVALLGLGLFLYVGFAEASRVYTQIRLERVAQLGAVLQHALNGFARSGLPLDQFGGFERRSAKLFETDKVIVDASLIGADGSVIFCANRTMDKECHQAGELRHTALSRKIGAGIGAELFVSGEHFLIRLPVEDKFGVVGKAQLRIDIKTVRAVVMDTFRVPFITAVALLLGFAFILILASRRGEASLRRVQRPVFFSVIAIMLVVLIAVMFNLYRKGTEGQAEALARSMANRLAAITELGIGLDDISGIQQAFVDYRRINPNVASLALIRDNQIYLHDDTSQIGHAHESRADRLEYVIELRGAIPLGGSTKHEKLQLSVELPISVVLAALWKGVRSFLALSFGAVLFSLVFMAAAERAGATANANRPTRPKTGPFDLDQAEAILALVRPAYFLGVFIDALTYSFLPEMSEEAVARQGLPEGWISIPFSLYFIGLTAALVPASHFAAKVDLKRLILFGIAFSAAGLAGIAFFNDFWAFCAGRALSGIGQGVLLVAIQTYAFEVMPSEHRTRAASIQVLGYNGGLIAGTAIGGLIATFNPDRDTVMIAATVGMLTLLYGVFAVPSLYKSQAAEKTKTGTLGAIRNLITDFDFMSVLTMVGMTSKFALAGIAMFAVPLLLYRSGYGDGDVGQALMVFAITTFLVTGVAARLVRQLGSTDIVLVVGVFMLAVGMAVIGAVLSAPAPLPDVWFAPDWISPVANAARVWIGGWAVPGANGIALALGVVALGIGQGLIAAPVVARVAATPVADRIGREPTLAVYRVSERAGHILGPLLIGPFLLLMSGNPAGLGVLAFLFMAIAAVYLATRLTSRRMV